MLNITKIVSDELGIRESQVVSTMSLIDAGNTVTFIARYRKEETGDLASEILFQLSDRVATLRELQSRKETVSRQITKYGKMSTEVQKKIDIFVTKKELDDYYEQFIPREESEGTKAIALGLQPLADVLKSFDDASYEILLKSLMVEKNLTKYQCEFGVENIIYEELQFDAEVKNTVRQLSNQKCTVSVKKKKKAEDTTYDMYDGFTADIKTVKPHNMLAILRGIREKQLDIKFEVNDELIVTELQKQRVGTSTGRTASIMNKLLGEVYAGIHKKSIAAEIKKELAEKAEERAVNVFAKNLYSLLMQKPLKGVKILGVDPGIRTGTKLALINENGAPMSTGIMKPLSKNRDDIAKAKEIMDQCIAAGVSLFAVGNGTASKENVNYIADYIRANGLTNVQFVVVSEAGASIYSTSEAARKEFPTLNEYQISAITIARRLQDPLAELVKLDPKTLGVGQYQHDVKGKKLDLELSRVVETCVNRVGVDLNTASPHLLLRVSGLTPKLVTEILKYRAQNKGFKARQDLVLVPGMTTAIFQQCAGFLRIYAGSNPLDSCFVHPESYGVAKRVLELQSEKFKPLAIANILSKEIGKSTQYIREIMSSVNAPRYDAREEGQVIEPVLRGDILSVKDLKIGDIFTGTVRSVTDFGGFIDIGVHQDGLVHISEISTRRITDIHLVLKIGQTVRVQVIKMDEARKKISLSMIIQKDTVDMVK